MSSTTTNYIDRITITQDAELAAFINEMKSDPTRFNAWVADQQSRVYTDITTQKDSTFKKVYGDLGLSSRAYEAYLLQSMRNKDLLALQKEMTSARTETATAATEDKNMAVRKNEMNEWSVNNKQDTLFVFSWLFIVLSCLILMTCLWRLELISPYTWTLFSASLILIFGLILIRRYFYTEHARNKRYWNKQIFEESTAKIPIPSCEDIQSAITPA